MNQKNQFNNNQNTKKNFFLIIISGIAALLLLIAIIFFIKKSKHKAQQEQTASENDKQPPSEKETGSEANQPTQEIPLTTDNNCPYLNEQNLINKRGLCDMSLHDDRWNTKEDLVKWRQIPKNYIIKLWKKGYHWHDILQLWGWNLPEADIPNLKSEKEIGIINTLAYLLSYPCSAIERLRTMSKEEKEIWKKKVENEELGATTKTIFIVRKSSASTINLDKNIQSGASPNGDTLKYVKKLINFILQQENINPQQYEISVLNCIGVENFGKEGDVKSGTVIGKSIGTAYYLGLLSSIHQKPINQAVAATGFINLKERKVKINDQEVNLSVGAALPIGGIKAKSFAATEKGINRLVLSKYQSSPNLLSQKAKYDPTKEVMSEDYQQVVPNEIKEKMRVYFAGNVSELRKLLLGGELS